MKKSGNYVVRNKRGRKQAPRRGAGRPASGDADVHINCRYPGALVKRMDMIRRSRKLTRTECLRAALVDWMQSHL